MGNCYSNRQNSSCCPTNIMQETVSNTVTIDDLRCVNCIETYVDNTQIIDFCGESALKVSFVVDIFYTDDCCERQQYSLCDSAVFLNYPRGFNMENMRATAHSIYCETCSCTSNLNVRTTVKVYG